MLIKSISELLGDRFGSLRELPMQNEEALS
jgi:hypothetical protein